MPVYLVRDGEELRLVILPVYGSGLWSTMYGLLALRPDANTVAGMSFYEQAETAGLGSEITGAAVLSFAGGELTYYYLGER